MTPLSSMEADRVLIESACARRRTERVRAFSLRYTPLIERTLAEATEGLGSELGEIERALAAAVGARGGGGRRWRPLLTLAAAEACGGTASDAAAVAAGVELTHTASLVLDDLPCMDDTAERRGTSATHRRVGSAGAILVAIGLLGRAAELLASSPRAGGRLAAEWGGAIGLCGMSGGQAIDLARPDGAAARRLLRAKTTALSAFALAAGAQAAGASTGAAETLRRYGRDLGWAYQLQDDAADLAEDAATGKRPGGRAPLRQSRYLLERAERRLRESMDVSKAGADLVIGFGRTVVACHADLAHVPA
jgi:geranylgeranyl diphosphate synthase, type II